MQNSQTTAVTTVSPAHFLPTSSAQRCVRHDLKQIDNIKDTPIIFVEPIEGNFLHLEAAITGPLSTPYENGIFLIDIKLSDQYPFEPPKSITFKRVILHPNVTEWGQFMSSLLMPAQWTPTMKLKNILEHIYALLAIPDVDSDQCDPIRAHSYKTNRQEFEKMAREYTIKHHMAT